MKKFILTMFILFTLPMLSGCGGILVLAGAPFAVGAAASGAQTVGAAIGRLAPAESPYECPPRWRLKRMEEGMSKAEAIAAWDGLQERTFGKKVEASKVLPENKTEREQPPNIKLSVLYLKYWGG